MKDKVKGLVTGLLIGSLLTGTAAYAAGGTMIEVFYSIKDLKIDKVSKMPQGEQKPFTYNGTTYVPLRFVAENLGQPVDWDGKTGTVYIGETEAPNEEYLGERIQPMNTFDNDGKINLVLNGKSVEDNTSTAYENYVSLAFSWYVNDEGLSLYQHYPLNGQYSSFKAKAGILKEYQDSLNTLTLVIEGDGKVLYSRDFAPGNFPVDLSVDVMGVNQLTLKVKMKEYVEDAVTGLGVFNPTLVQ